MKKHFLLFISILIFCFATIIQAQSSPSVSTTSVEACPGEVANIDINLQNNVGFTYMKLAIGYDENALELTEVSNGTIIENFVNDAAYVWYSGTDVTENGVLATLSFKINDTASVGTYQISINVIECSNYNEEDVEVSISNGNISVKNNDEENNQSNSENTSGTNSDTSNVNGEAPDENNSSLVWTIVGISAGALVIIVGIIIVVIVKKRIKSKK